MGYPMTYKRVINRNRLDDGAYQDTPVDWHAYAPTVAWDVVEAHGKDEILALLRTMVEHHNAAAATFNGKVSMLAGDLRRLERDTVDESVVCLAIARKLDADPDLVAAVLKEWMEC